MSELKDKLLRQLDEMAKNADLWVKGWDGYAAEPVRITAIQAARDWVRRYWRALEALECEHIDAFPTQDGGVELEDTGDSGLVEFFTIVFHGREHKAE